MLYLKDLVSLDVTLPMIVLNKGMNYINPVIITDFKWYIINNELLLFSLSDAVKCIGNKIFGNNEQSCILMVRYLL